MNPITHIYQQFPNTQYQHYQQNKNKNIQAIVEVGLAGMISTETNAVGSIKTRDMDAHGVKWSEASRVSSADFCLHEFCCFFAISFLF